MAEKLERISQNKQESNCKMANKNPGLKLKKDLNKLKMVANKKTSLI